MLECPISTTCFFPAAPSALPADSPVVVSAPTTRHPSAPDNSNRRSQCCRAGQSSEAKHTEQQTVTSNGSGKEETLVQVARVQRPGHARDAASRRSCKRPARRVQGQTPLGEGDAICSYQHYSACCTDCCPSACFVQRICFDLHSHRRRNSSSKTAQAYSLQESKYLLLKASAGQSSHKLLAQLFSLTHAPATAFSNSRCRHLIRRFDTEAISASSLFKVAFPTASEDAESV